MGGTEFDYSSKIITDAEANILTTNQVLSLAIVTAVRNCHVSLTNSEMKTFWSDGCKNWNAHNVRRISTLSPTLPLTCCFSRKNVVEV